MDNPDSNAPALLDALRLRLAASGLNHVGVADVVAYDAVATEALRSAVLAPYAQAIVVVASGGGALWDHLIDEISAEPARLTETLHPLDGCVRRGIASVEDLLDGVRHRWFFAVAETDVHLDFRTLAVAAGLGAPSRLGLVLDARYGPWMGLRAACFIDAALPASPTAPDRCAGCDAPCIEACPGGAFPEGQWDVHACSAFHRESDRCAQSCAARVACPVGEAHRYSELERRYHYDRAGGRRALRSFMGIADAQDPFEGVGPHWGDWVSPK
jgi:epoxyqueuosine reductase QueG